MFGHLKAEEFVTLMDGGDVSAKRRGHLGSCPQCTATLAAMESLQDRMTVLGGMEAGIEDGLPEPDWSEFRASVRNELLSRSVQRETSIHRWTGWSFRPAMAWSLSLVFTVALTAGFFTWKPSARTSVKAETATGTVPDVALESSSGETVMTAWRSADVFEEVAQLKADEAENLQLLLKDAIEEIPAQ